MSEIAIRVRDLDKVYSIGVSENKSDTLVGSIANMLKSPIRNFRNLKNLHNADSSDRIDRFSALKDINFDIPFGEATAIIGRNGAGKSTLLKIISRITDPTNGKIEIFGRVSSLLEIGTGFHPELTGRENVYLNGTILGMRKHEIDNKFDEIVEFSGIHKFIDTPTKRYSSGMRIRLAFSVAANLEAEILLIDEVLAVGDAEFQKKCLNKMNEVTGQGRTVLFISHNMGAVKELCTRGIVLDHGRMVFDGKINDSILKYYEIVKDNKDLVTNSNKLVTLGSPLLDNKNDFILDSWLPFKISIPISCYRMIRDPRLIWIIEDFMGQQMINLSLDSTQIGVEVIEGQKVIEVEFPTLWFSPGIYSAHFKILVHDTKESGGGQFNSEKIFFDVPGNDEAIKSGFYTGEFSTALAPVVKWNVKDLANEVVIERNPELDSLSY